MSHPAYKPPLHFVLRLRLQKRGGDVFAGHYGISHRCGGFKLCRVELRPHLQGVALFREISARACFMMDDCMPSGWRDWKSLTLM